MSVFFFQCESTGWGGGGLGGVIAERKTVYTANSKHLFTTSFLKGRIPESEAWSVNVNTVVTPAITCIDWAVFNTLNNKRSLVESAMVGRMCT